VRKRLVNGKSGRLLVYISGIAYFHSPHVDRGVRPIEARERAKSGVVAVSTRSWVSSRW
jgi:hypothetical protein